MRNRSLGTLSISMMAIMLLCGASAPAEVAEGSVSPRVEPLLDFLRDIREFVGSSQETNRDLLGTYAAVRRSLEGDLESLETARALVEKRKLAAGELAEQVTAFRREVDTLDRELGEAMASIREAIATADAMLTELDRMEAGIRESESGRGEQPVEGPTELDLVREKLAALQLDAGLLYPTRHKPLWRKVFLLNEGDRLQWIFIRLALDLASAPSVP